MSAAEASTHRREHASKQTLVDVDACNSNGHFDFPCSAAQRRIWVLEQLRPLDTSLNLSVRWQLRSLISSPSQLYIEQAFKKIVARQEIFRTTFFAIDGEPMQRVAAAADFHVMFVDLTSYSTDQANVEIDRLAKLEAQTPFDLTIGPLLRVTQIQIDARVSILLLTTHSIVCDASSLSVLARELIEHYTALQRGCEPSLPYLPLSYGDYGAAQMMRWDEAVTSTEFDYWKRSLADANVAVMPTDRSRSAVRTASNVVTSSMLPSSLVDELKRIAADHDCTLFTMALAAIITLMHRHSDETDITIASQHEERDAPEFRNLIGPFTHSLILRNDLSGDTSFVELLKRVHATVTDVLQHQRMPIGEIIKPSKLDPTASANHATTNFIFQESFISNESSGALRLIDESLIAAPAFSSETASDLTFIWRNSVDGWQITCDFNPDLFDHKTITNWLIRLQNILAAVAHTPEQMLSRLPILSADERHALIVDYNRTDAPYPSHLTVLQLFAAQVALTPKACALVCGDSSLTYEGLDTASNQLARELCSRNVGPHSRVAVLLDRSTDLVIALLAILKSGNAYVPLDPNYPSERLLHVFDNANIAAVISRSTLHERVLKTDAQIICVDTDKKSIEQQSTRSLNRPVNTPTPQDVAYVIYTSGSTGVPKGVEIQHKAMTNFLWAMRSTPGITAHDTLVSVTTVSFDIAVLEIFLPLIVGAKVVAAQDKEIADGRELHKLLRRHTATIMQATPVTWQLLMDAGWHQDPPLKMLCGGEAMSRKLADALLLHGAELWNMYGPTETTVWSAALRVIAGEGPVAIGAPIANTKFYVLDRHLQLVPPGTAGELFIAGDGVALGYVNLPIVTDEKFLADPFQSSPHARMYRTGDIVRMRTNGDGYQLDYLGRADQQIKLRGFRIELGEIESVLLRHPEVKQAVALLGDVANEPAIRAYVVPKNPKLTLPGQLPTALTAELRASFEKYLPRYMHPASVVTLESLPCTPNGKVDRLALKDSSPGLPIPPAMPNVQAKDKTSRNNIESRLTAIWSSVLNIRDIDSSADFFALGGHSLLAARLLNCIEAEFSRRLTLAMLFDAPTIRSQAHLLTHDDSRQYDFRQLVRLHPTGSKPPLIAIHNTGVYYYNLSKQLGPDQPLTALQLFDPLMIEKATATSMEAIATEYVRLMRQVQPEGPYQLIGWCIGGVLAFEVACQLTAAGQEVAFLGLIDAWAPGHLQRMSKLRAALADESYRAQLIWADWRKVLSGQRRLSEFIAHRKIVKRVMRLLGLHAVDESKHVSFDQRSVSNEYYDQWLQGYLEEAERHYQPKIYPGRVVLFCSSTEPRGLFLDPEMGWRPFAAGGIRAQVLVGDHFTMFQGKGLTQMARTISSALQASSLHAVTN